MAAPDAKKTATLLIASLGKPKGMMGMGMGKKMESVEEDSMEIEPNLAEEAFKSACQDVLDAIKADAIDKFCSAMKDAIRACEDMEAPEDEED